LEQQAETYLGYVERLGGACWEGRTAEAAQARARQDVHAVTRVHDTVGAAARQITNNVSANLMPPLANAKQIIANAEANEGVHVKEDLSISYTPPPGVGMETANANQKIVGDAEAELKAEASKWWAAENDVADQIRDAESAVGKNLVPERNSPHIQLVDRHIPLPQDPAPVPPTDPRIATEQARADYDRLKTQILGHNANPPSLNDASAVNTYNQNADALNAKKAALEAQLGKNEAAPAQKGHFVPDWVRPGPQQRHPGSPGPAHQRLDITTPHARELGADPGIGGRFRPEEAETGLRVEAQRGITLQRSPHEGADWIDPASGKSYDAVGNFDGRYLNLSKFLDEVVAHSRKADCVPVDVSQFSAEQRSDVRRFVDGLGKPNVFIVGDYGSGG
jgi:hypothetical protein